MKSFLLGVTQILAPESQMIGKASPFDEVFTEARNAAGVSKAILSAMSDVVKR